MTARGDTSRPNISLLRQVVVYVVGRVGVQATGLLSTPFYVRDLGPTRFGGVEILMVLVLSTAIASYGVLGPAALRLTADVPDVDRSRIWASTFWLSVVLELVFAVPLVVAGSRLLADLDHFEAMMAIWAAAICFPLSVMQQHGLQVLAADGRASAHLVSSVAGAAVSAVLSILLTVVAGLGPAGVLVALAVGYATSVAIAAAATGPAVWRPDLSAAFAVARYGVRLLPYNVAAWALIYVDRLILLRYWPTGEVGRYAVAYKVASVVGLLAAAVGTAWAPAVLRAAASGDAGALFRRGMPAIVSGAGTAAGAIALFAHPLLSIFAGPSFADAAAMVPPVGVGMVGLAVVTIAQAALLVEKRPGLQSTAAITAACTAVGMCVVLVPRHGGIGAAVATAVAYWVDRKSVV